MKLRALRLRQVRRFVEPVAIESISGGLDVLVGPNEAGKSTFLAALETLFLEKHTIAGKKLDCLRPHGGGEPLIEADFDACGQRWRIVKQFGRGRKAELMELGSGRIVARSSEAEQKLAELIGAGEGQRGGPGLLWAGQKSLLTPVALESDKGERSEAAILYRAIEREVASATGGSEARAVRALAAEALGRLVSEKRRAPKAGGPYEGALQKRDHVRAALAEAREIAAEARGRLKVIAEQRQHRANAPAAIAELEVQLKKLNADLDAKRAAAQKLATARAEERSRRMEAKAAEEALAELDSALQELATIEPLSLEDAARAVAANDELALRRAEAEKLEAAEAELSAELQRLGDLGLRRSKADERAVAAREMEGKSRALAAARLIATGIAKAREETDAGEIDSSTMERLETLAREAAMLEARLTAAAPTLRIALEAGGAGRLLIDGDVVAADRELKVMGPLVIDLPGIGRIAIEPGASPDRVAVGADLAQRRGEIGRLLECCGVASLEEARVSVAQSQARQRAIAEAEARLEGMAPRGVEALAHEVAELGQRLAAEPEDADVPERAEIEARREEARSRHRAVRETLEKARVAAARSIEAYARAESDARQRKERLQALIANLPPPAVRGEERALRAMRREQCALGAGEAVRTVAALAEAAPQEGEVDRLVSQRQDLERELERRRTALADLVQSIARLEGAQEQVDEAGSSARVPALEGELQRAEREVSRFEAEVAELNLLLSALAEAERQARERSFRPVTSRLGAYLELVLPGVKAVLGDGLTIDAIERSGLSEAIGSLSDGTQEQLAVLVRLAFARLLAETGEAVPLILDDALVYADDERIVRMFAALEAAARHHQVIVLTCRARTFESLAGNRLSVTPWRVE